MPYFNTSNLTNASDYIEVMQYIDESAGYYFGPLVVMAIWFISFMAMGLFAKEEAFAGASIIAFITSIFIWAAIGSWYGVAVALAAVLASGLMLFLRR